MVAPRGEAVIHPHAARSTRSVEGISALEDGENVNGSTRPTSSTGPAGSERELADRYRTDPRLHPGATVRCLSPTGTESVVDLRSRVVAG
jgi:hypothetical protein